MNTQEEKLDVDLELIFVMAVRYSLGRDACMAHVAQRCIRARLTRLSGAALSCLEDTLAGTKDGDAIDAEDVDGWLRFLGEIREEQQRRSEGGGITWKAPE